MSGTASHPCQPSDVVAVGSQNCAGPNLFSMSSSSWSASFCTPKVPVTSQASRDPQLPASSELLLLRCATLLVPPHGPSYHTPSSFTAPLHCSPSRAPALHHSVPSHARTPLPSLTSHAKAISQEPPAARLSVACAALLLRATALSVLPSRICSYLLAPISISVILIAIASRS
jgi:hypothetical protein